MPISQTLNPETLLTESANPDMHFDSYAAVETTSLHLIELIRQISIAAQTIDNPHLISQLVDQISIQLERLLTGIDHYQLQTLNYSLDDLEPLRQLSQEIAEGSFPIDPDSETDMQALEALHTLCQEIDNYEQTGGQLSDYGKHLINLFASTRNRDLTDLGKKIATICRQISAQFIHSLNLREYFQEASQNFRLNLLGLLDDVNTPIYRSTYDRLLGYLSAPDHRLRTFAAGYITELGYLRDEQGQHLMIETQTRLKQILVSYLLSGDSLNLYTANLMLGTLAGERWYYLIIEAAMEIVDTGTDSTAVCQAIGLVAHRIEFSELINRINSEKPEIYKKLMQAIHFGAGEVVTHSNELYQQFDISEFKPNAELDSFEQQLELTELQSLQTTGDIHFLEAAMGPIARHSAFLQGQTINNRTVKVFGFDLLPASVESAVSTGHIQNAVAADWNLMPFADGSMDFISLLGRSSHHASSPRKLETLLRELHRVCSDNGEVLLDLAEFGKGHYGDNPTQVKDQLASVGIERVETGILLDSADNIHAIQRFAPLRDQFVALALLCGFAAKEVAEKEFSYKPGQVNNNVYWRLTKRQSDLSEVEQRFVMDKAQTTYDQLDFVSY